MMQQNQSNEGKPEGQQELQGRWLDSLPSAQLEKVHEFMRSVWGQIDALLKDVQKRRPESGRVGGGAHLDSFVRAEALSMFLRALRQGKPPEEALKLAKEEGSFCFRRWNETCKKDIYMQRWDKSADNFVEDTYRSLKRILELPQ